MSTKFKAAGFIAVGLGVVTLAGVLLRGHPIAVLNPKGPVARGELHLMIIAVLLMLIVVIPVFALTIGIAWKYRATNTKARYTPDWDRNKLLETTWWAFPCAIIAVLAVIAWTSSHALDPYKPLASSTPQMTIQVVAMDWKWLFIYPQQNIATVNYVEFPKGTPVNFEITSDAPMNSFWIPQLGGQIYAMPGMSTQLHLMADSTGSFAGSSANISGQGFAGMKFTARSTTGDDFNRWVSSVKHAPQLLSLTAYNNLAKPSLSNAPAYYSSADPGLYDEVVMKFTLPASDMSIVDGNGRPVSVPLTTGTSMTGLEMP